MRENPTYQTITKWIAPVQAWAKEQASWLLVALVLIVALAFRLVIYEDWGESIATSDTIAYVETSRLSFPGRGFAFFTSNRPATIALFYKLFEPEGGYQILRVSRPAFTGTTLKLQQPTFTPLVLAQQWISVLAWSALAIATARRLKSTALKPLAALTILAFGYSPPLVEWNNVLMSEPLSFSLFALVLAVSFELADRLQRARFIPQTRNWLWSVLWLILITLWVFARDSNAYALPLVVLGIIGLLLFPSYRKRLTFLGLMAIAVTLSILFLLHSRSLSKSDRWINPFFNNLIYRVFPFDRRVDFFSEHGMPITEELLALQESRGNEPRFWEMDKFMEWVWEEGQRTYMLFLLDTPRWAVQSLVGDLESLFSENRQPYFHEGYEEDPFWVVPLGNLLHMTSSGAGLLSLGMIIALLWHDLQSRLGDRGDLIVLVWLVLVEWVILAVSYHGDSLGVVRHTLLGVMPVRLSLWLLGFFLTDRLLHPQGKARSATRSLQAEHHLRDGI